MATNKTFIFFLVFVLVAMNGSAQNDKSTKVPAWQFHSINQLGFLEGSDGTAFQMQTINGVQYKSWFAGVGVGIDNYRFRSIPLFADFRKEFVVGKNYFFAYGGVGAHFMWLTNKQKTDYHQTNNGADGFSNGLYYDAGIGYQVKLNSRIGIFVSPGFSHKSTEAKLSTPICPFYGPCYVSIDKYNYALNRLSVMVGVVF